MVPGWLASEMEDNLAVLWTRQVPQQEAEVRCLRIWVQLSALGQGTMVEELDPATVICSIDIRKWV